MLRQEHRPCGGRGRPSQTITAPPAWSRLRAGAQSRGEPGAHSYQHQVSVKH